MKNNKLKMREWFSVLLIGFAGQLAWVIENNYINMWVYSQTGSSTYITWMTIASAIAATLTTFFMGVLSDRLGKRKIFIAGGYTIWGLSVVLFGFCSRSNMGAMFGAGNAALAVGISMVVVDCLMTFFGSTANDACFNARVTDVTNENNRGKVESVLSVLPLFATVVVLLIAGLLGANSSPSSSQATAIAEAGTTSYEFLAKPWMIFFIIFGSITTLIGIVSFFLLPNDSIAPNKKEPYMKNLVYGFRPSVIKKNKNLYIALLSFMAFNLAIDAFMPYFMVYFQNPVSSGGVGLSGTNFYLAMGSILVAASLIVILLGLFVMDKVDKTKLLIPALFITALGFLTIYFSKELWSVIISGIIMMSGYLIGTAILGSIIRNETPKEEVGLFQGVRMVFCVMLPMIIGSSVSDAAMKAAGGTYINEFGEEASRPISMMFLVALGFVLLAIIPSIWLYISKKKTAKPLSSENKEEA